MMVIRKRSGFEVFAQQPRDFFGDVLLLNVSAQQDAYLRAIVDGRRSSLGVIYRPSAESDPTVIDDLTLVVGIALWRAVACHRPTVIWGGRRTMASAWFDHTVLVLQSARFDFRHNFRLLRAEQPRDKPWGIMTPSGEWAMRYDGPMREDPLRAVRTLGNRADVLLGDFDWIDRVSVTDARRYADEHGALVTAVVGQGVPAN